MAYLRKGILIGLLWLVPLVACVAVEVPAFLRMPPLPVEESIVVAEAILHDEIRLKGLEGPIKRRPDGGIDWRDWGPKEDKEWAWFLNRHLYFRDLCAAYNATGKEAYLERIRDDLADWLTHEPSPERLNFTPSWRALEVARRLQRSWIPLFAELPVGHPIADEIRALMVSSLPDHGAMLYHHPSFWGGNHLVTEKTMLAAIAVLWPEIPEAEAWFRRSSESMISEVVAQTYPDGAYKELSNHYHRIALEGFSVFQGLAEMSPHPVVDSLHQLVDRITAMWSYFAGVVRPDGFGPLNNDSDLENNRIYIERRMRSEGDTVASWRDYAAFLSSAASIGASPSRVYPDAGHAVMRSGWDADAEWAFFDAGPAGTAHEHVDALHLSVQLGSEPFLVDAGRYHYRPDAWRIYFRGPASHNTVILEDAEPVDRIRESKPGTADFLQVRIEDGVEGFGGRAQWRIGRGLLADHYRWILYSRNNYWLVLDEVSAPGAIGGSLKWHFHPECIINLLPEDNRLEASAASGSNLTFDLWSSARTELREAKGSVDPVEGWYSPYYNIREAASVALLKFRAFGPVRMVTLIREEAGEGFDVRETPVGLLVRIGEEAFLWPEGHGEDAYPRRFQDATEIR